MWKSSACENANGHKIKETEGKIINVHFLSENFLCEEKAAKSRKQ